MKKIPLIIWPIAGICFLLALSAFFLVNRFNVAIVSSNIRKLIPKESLKISDINFSQDYNNGQKKWKLKAKEASFFEKDQLVVLKHVLLTLGHSDKDPFIIEGREGNYFKDRGEITLKGDVTGKSFSGYQINTDQLSYNQKNESVETDDPVKITGPFFTIIGDGLHADIKGEKFIIKRNVRTTFIMGESYK